jgi:hypothetical protein
LTKFLSKPVEESIFIIKPGQSVNLNNINDYASSVGKSSIRHLNDNKMEKIIQSIKDDRDLWLKILKFQKVDLKEVKEVLNKKGVIVENESLRSYLTTLGVILN